MKVRRSTGADLETRTATLTRSAVNGRNFTGAAAVFNTRVAIGNPLQWGFYEELAPTVFDNSLRSGDVVQLADHDPAKPLSRMSTGTLRLTVDAAALNVDSDLVATSYADDLIANVAAGNVRGQSFGFQTVSDDWRTETVTTNDGMSAEVEIRTLLEVKLIEVSTTAFPAYPTTTADVRSALASRATRDGFADMLAEFRVGAVLSAASLASLQCVADHNSAAMDILAQLMNGDTPDPDPEPEANTGFPLDLAIRHRQLAERYGLARTA